MKLSKAQRAALREMFGGRCAYCGCDLGERWHADHVEHVERKMGWVEKDGRRKLACVGGVHRPERDTVENLMPACPPCNIDKHAMTLEDWRGKLARTLDVLNRNNPTYRHAVRFGMIEETPAPIVFHFECIKDARPFTEEEIAGMRKWAKESDERATLKRAEEILTNRAQIPA